MSQSFLKTLTAVLAHEPEIEGLPNHRLRASSEIGTPLDHEIGRKAFHKIVRLQTLWFNTIETSDTSNTDFKGLAAATHQHIGEAMSSALSIQEDTTRRLTMIERLIVEVVREAIPSECERLNVRYVAHMSQVVMYLPVVSRRFLD